MYYFAANFRHWQEALVCFGYIYNAGVAFFVNDEILQLAVHAYIYRNDIGFAVQHDMIHLRMPHHLQKRAVRIGRNQIFQIFPKNSAEPIGPFAADAF